jgi:hypothetical protein
MGINDVIANGCDDTTFTDIMKDYYSHERSTHITCKWSNKLGRKKEDLQLVYNALVLL